ncbi:Fic/DOC family protein [Delftia sp. GW456-R20]|uniref:Fic/DOC family protein n=1 Tax=Delftia sp. GW456-R20 TaxID=1827145 RepID=UPI0009ED1DE8|nr:Fic family protein [Delftia sp. GW456-R20]
MNEDVIRRWNSYFYQGTNVLINLPGFREPNALKQFEYGMAISRTVELSNSPISGKFDLEHLQAIHKHLFQDTYEWAGKLRDVPMAKGKSIGFEKPERLTESASKIHNDLVANGYLKNLNKKNFVEKLSILYSDLNRLHPFREGNGRSTRVFIGQIAERAGYTLDQTRIDNSKGLWNDAAAKSMDGNIQEIAKILSEAIRPSRSVAFERLSQERALEKHPELKPLFEKLAATGAVLDRTHPGNAKAKDHFLNHQRKEMIRRLDTGEVKGLAISEKIDQRDGRFENQMKKAQDFANSSIQDPVARATFLAKFQERLNAIERQSADSKTKQEISGR